VSIGSGDIAPGPTEPEILITAPIPSKNPFLFCQPCFHVIEGPLAGVYTHNVNYGLCYANEQGRLPCTYLNEEGRFFCFEMFGKWDTTACNQTTEGPYFEFNKLVEKKNLTMKRIKDLELLTADLEMILNISYAFEDKMKDLLEANLPPSRKKRADDEKPESSTTGYETEISCLEFSAKLNMSLNSNWTFTSRDQVVQAIDDLKRIGYAAVGTCDFETWLLLERNQATLKEKQELIVKSIDAVKKEIGLVKKYLEEIQMKLVKIQEEIENEGQGTTDSYIKYTSDDFSTNLFTDPWVGDQ